MEAGQAPWAGGWRGRCARSALRSRRWPKRRLRAQRKGHRVRPKQGNQAATTTAAAAGRISTDVLFVRFLQEERLERPRRLLHQSVDDLVQVGAGDLDETGEPRLKTA